MSIDKNFVIKNGLEVDAGTLYVNPDTSSVGVGTTNPNYNLEVKGIIGLSSAISVGGTTGISGQILFSTGDNAEWRALPNLRETVIEIATENQTTFPSGSVFDHNPLYLDVFLNGVKLRKTAEYNSVNSDTKVDILVPTYAGDVVELVTYSTNTFASGAQGIQGVSGQDGAQGATGPQGTDGAFAAQGITGSQGIQGIIGLQGIQGVQGTPGGQGIQGGPGIQGDRGVQGSNGPQGPQGLQGTQGQLGIQGPFGYQGVQGIQGTTGIQGDLGVQGPPGSGSQGIQGITGAQGAAGVLGGDGAQGIQGIQGIQGEALQGTQGTSGSAVAQGIQGIQGIQGSGGTQGTDGAFAGQGIQGIQGLQGIIGPQGTEGVGTQGTDGPTGPQGTQGTFGPQGTQGTLGLTGNQGIQGTQGIVGPQGANATTVNYTLSETGAITRSFTDKLDDFVNALDFGLVEGSGQNSATQTANTSRLIDALETERAVYIPSGTYELNGEILTQDKNVTIVGDSERTTILKWMSTNGANGIDWTTSSPERTLNVKNVRLVAAADKTGSPIYAKDLATTGGSIIPNVVLENVVAEYEGPTSQWEHGFQFLDCRNSYANRVVFRGNPSLSTDYGFLLAGTEIGCIDFKLNQCQVSDVRGNTGTAFLVRAAAEGIGISNCLAINCNEGVRSDNHINSDGNSTAEPFLSVHNCHFNVHVYGIYLERVLQSFITNNHIQACDFTSAGSLVDWYGVYFEGSSAGIRCSNIHIANNIFHANFPGRSGRTDLGLLIRYADHISVNNNQFMGCDSPGIKINSNVNDSEVLNNRFDDCVTPEVSNVGGNVTVVSFGSTTVNELGGGVNNISDDLTPELGGDLDLNGNNIIGTGNINISGIITATTVNTTAGGGTPNITSPNNLNLNANNVAISTNLTVGGSATFGDSSSDNITFTGEINSHYIPSADSTFDLGSSSRKIRDLYISNNSIIFESGNKLGINTNGNLSIDGNTIEARIEGTHNVMDYGAVANGVTDDTNAFNNAIIAAGDYGNVYAPPGNYKVNGITISGNGQNINIDGTLIVGVSDTAIIFDKPSGTSTQYCKLYVKEIKHTSTSARPTDNSTGVYIKNGSFNTIEFGRIGFVHYAFVLDPSTKTPVEGLTSDNRIKGHLIEFCRYGVYSNGGSNVSQNHTEHTMVEVNFIAHYEYGIYKTNSAGSQKFWYVNTAFDAFPGPNNTDYVADVFDDYIQSNDENLSSCLYQCFFSTDNNAFKGNAFEIGRNCFLFDYTRRRTNFGNRVKFDTYLGEIECTGPDGALDAGGLVLTSSNGTKYRLFVDNFGNVGTTTVRYVPNYIY